MNLSYVICVYVSHLLEQHNLKSDLTLSYSISSPSASVRYIVEARVVGDFALVHVHHVAVFSSIEGIRLAVPAVSNGGALTPLNLVQAFLKPRELGV